MFRLVHLSTSRLVLSFLFSFSLIYGPIISLRAVRAEKPAPIKPTGNPQPVTMPHKEGEIIVKFKQEAPQSLRDLVVRTYAGNEKRLRGRGGLSKLKIKDGLDLSDTIFTLKQLNAVVEYAEPNYLVTRTGAINRIDTRSNYFKIPNDSRFNLQWGALKHRTE